MFALGPIGATLQNATFYKASSFEELTRKKRSQKDPFYNDKLVLFNPKQSVIIRINIIDLFSFPIRIKFCFLYYSSDS
ncbi:Uncharacterised protein [Yersinia intermedia]|nr:Uncharacterised protein [Yersinia intermedia]CNH34564.1 Uncharacterised protein [Yersinia intermedia]